MFNEDEFYREHGYLPPFTMVGVCDFCKRFTSVCCGNSKEGHCNDCHERDIILHYSYDHEDNDQDLGHYEMYGPDPVYPEV